MYNSGTSESYRNALCHQAAPNSSLCMHCIVCDGVAFVNRTSVHHMHIIVSVVPASYSA